MNFKKKQVGITLLHLGFGYLVSLYPVMTYYWGIGVLLIGIADIISNGNRDNRGAKWAAYYMAAEVLLRMTNGYIFWEAGKYGVAMLLIAGIVSEPFKRPVPVAYLAYFLLLLPSLLVVDFPDLQIAREEISFNLSGPLVLTVSALYFFGRTTTGSDFVTILSWTVMPLLVMLVYLILVTPDIQEIEFGTESNFQAAGGFGPNQVSTTIGLAIFALAIGRFYKFSLCGFIAFDVALLVLFAIRGLVTFSRGGVMGGVIGILVLIVYAAFAAKSSRKILTTLSFAILASLAGFYIWNHVNEKTDGKLEYRYKGVNYRTGGSKDITSGRTEIMLKELHNFIQHPLLGIGPGMGTLIVKNRADIGAHSHSEYTRLLSEHGLFGLVALLILIVVPVIKIFKTDLPLRPLLLSLYIFMLFTLFHSAMRLALPGFIYGLCLINPVSNNHFKKNGPQKT